jgi:hypothetical protein
VLANAVSYAAARNIEPLVLLLGGACISNAALGLLLPEIPFALFGVIDGALKVLVGLGSLQARPAGATPPL